MFTPATPHTFYPPQSDSVFITLLKASDDETWDEDDLEELEEETWNEDEDWDDDGDDWDDDPLGELDVELDDDWQDDDVELESRFVGKIRPSSNSGLPKRPPITPSKPDRSSSRPAPRRPSRPKGEPDLDDDITD